MSDRHTYDVEVKITRRAEGEEPLGTHFLFEANDRVDLRTKMGHGINEALLAFHNRDEVYGIVTDKVAQSNDVPVGILTGKWDIWSEGFGAQGQAPAQASKIASDIEAPSFHEAVEKWWNGLNDKQRKYWGGSLVMSPGDEPSKNRYSIWGVGLHDNEADARDTSFG